MKTINISTLKAKASQTLKDVREGETYLILDRDIPIAELRPLQTDTKIKIRKPLRKLQMPKIPFVVDKDPMEFLLEDREKR